MKKNILFRAALLLITIAVCEPTMAEKISLSQAKTIANRFAGNALSSGSASRQKTTSALSLAYKSQSEELYAFNVGQGSGFVLVAGDDLVQSPILGYSDEGSFNYDEMCDVEKGWIEQYAQTIAYAREHNIVVESSAALASESYKSVGPLITTNWDQYPLYNALCPIVAGKQTVVGCGSVALAQVIKFHNYPEHGIGSRGYSDSTLYNGTVYHYDVFADFEHTTYDWANMPNRVNGSCTEAQINAVATLMYHCGVAAKARYGVYNTSTSHDDEASVLTKYFGYDKGLQYKELDYYTLEEWADSLKSDLDAGIPILYSGSSEMQGFHGSVIDGYLSTGTFHINWGWGGLGNGYFSLLKIRLGTDDQNFNNGQNAVFHIIPDRGGEEKCDLLEYLLSSSQDTLNVDENGSKIAIASCYQHFNIDTMDVTTYMTLENKVTGETQDVAKLQQKMGRRSIYNMASGMFCDFNGVKDGEYKLYLTYETSNVSKRKARSESAYQGYLDVTVKGNIVIFGEDYPVGIHKVLNAPNAAAKGDGSIFNLSGQKVGTDWETLSPGIYLKGGEKILKK